MPQQSRYRPPQISLPVYGQHPSTHLLQSSGVAIFHLRTSRIVVCYHTKENHWFLPKGRRDVGEGIEAAGEREGYEESGYLNRLLPLPLPHCQTYPTHIARENRDKNVTEPVWLQMMPLNRVVQYILHWYVAETVPPHVEEEVSASMQKSAAARPAGGGERGDEAVLLPYRRPPPFPQGITLRERIAMEPADYEPVQHSGTALQEDEKYYESYLLSVEEAMKKLSGTVEADVVRLGWEGIEKRIAVEDRLTHK